MTADVVLYREVVRVVEDYLGPAAGRFIDRQITFHLGINPNSLTEKDLQKLAEWVKVSLSLLTSDHETVETATNRILKLARKA